MSDFFAPWVRMQQQMIQQHKANVETVFRQMDKSGFEGAAKAAKELADAQVDAWEKWLAMWGPRA